MKKICPKCKRAYKDLNECPIDHVPLVDEAELSFQAVPGETTTWVEITSVGTDDQARLLQGFLEAEGIPAVIENVSFSMEPVTFGKLGEIRIYVSADDEQRALELIRQREQEFEKLADDDDTLVTDEGVVEVDENVTTETE
jgi:hypothetical protein